jgi:hypothetical protein
MRREKHVVATTDQIPAYGGFRLEPEDLELLAQSLMSQSVPMRLSHDAREPLYVENVDAEIRQRPDGEYQLWVEFDVEEEGWARYEAERDARGALGGLSFTITETIDQLTSEAMPGLASIEVAADAHHFSDNEILGAADEFANAGNVKASRLYQFSAVPAALVLIQFTFQELAQIPPGIISAWLYDAWQHFRRPGQPDAALTLEFIEGPRKTTASIPASIDPIIAVRAIEAVESIANQPGTYECMPDGSWRIIRDHRQT